MSGLSHLDEAGRARMVDVGEKPVTRRRAVARGRITMSAEPIRAIREGMLVKGDVLAAARIAGIMAAKRTDELIPLCHPLGIDSVVVDFALHDEAVEVTARVTVSGRTGVEMEAMTAACVALLTIYDMVKSLDKGMVVEDVRLIAKDGGKSGRWRAPGYEDFDPC